MIADYAKSRQLAREVLICEQHDDRITRDLHHLLFRAQTGRWSLARYARSRPTEQEREPPVVLCWKDVFESLAASLAAGGRAAQLIDELASVLGGARHAGPQAG